MLSGQACRLGLARSACSKKVCQVRKSSLSAGEPNAKGKRLKLMALLCAGTLSFITGLICGDHVEGLPKTGEAPNVAAQEPAEDSPPVRSASLVFPANGGPDAAGASAAGGKTLADPTRLLPPPGEFQHQAALILGCNEMARHYLALFGEMASALHRNIPLIAVVSNQSEMKSAQAALAKCKVPPSAVRFLVRPVNTLWVRDYVPVFARRADGSVLLADFLYDLPGEKEHRPLDEAFGQVLGDVLGLPVQPVPLTVEGGNLVTNGEGLVVTTHSLVARNAARGYDAPRVEKILKESFGYTLWVRVPGLVGEPTQHADMYMTFLAGDVLVVGRVDPAVDPQNAAMLDGVAKAMASIDGPRGPIKVYRIPMPAPAKAGDGWRTYTNIVLANGVLLMPTFSGVDQAAQAEALALYTRLMPGWKVVGINSDVLVPHMGLLHCICRQVPAFVSLPPSLRPGSAGPTFSAPAAPSPIYPLGMPLD
jgi:agmatine/peptidylarginine deiminase